MGGDKQVTIMVLKVDLQCQRCYKKVKKVLCKFPQIQDQVYDEKKNTVTIKVVCCSPEKIKQKIKCKGGDSIKGIEIIVPEIPKPKDPDGKPQDNPKPQDKPKDPPKPQDNPKGPDGKPQDKPKDPPKPQDKPKDPPKPQDKPKDPPKPQDKPKDPPSIPVPCVPGYPKGQFPMRTCCPDCYEGRPGGPCFYGCGPVGPPPCYQYDGYYGRPVYDSYGCGRSYYATRCDCFSEENTGACTIM